MIAFGFCDIFESCWGTDKDDVLRATNVVEIFAEATRAMRAAVPMVPRSASDKEYFPQDWFIDRLKLLGLPYEQQGRNSYPDFWVGSSPVEGFEIKSLAFANGKAARADYDCNSSIPSGRKQQRDVFLAFFLYTGTGASPRVVHSLSIAHGDVINSDYAVADAHMNPSVHGFGSYGDGFIRNRKMYVFPHPFTLDPAGIGRCRLIVPADWNLPSARLHRVNSLRRTVSDTAIESYSVDMRSAGSVSEQRVPYQLAGTVRLFDVLEAI